MAVPFYMPPSKAEVVQLIYISAMRGGSGLDDPARSANFYFSFDGRLVACYDPINDEAPDVFFVPPLKENPRRKFREDQSFHNPIPIYAPPDRAEVVQLIYFAAMRGGSGPDNPAREVHFYFSFEGQLMACYDPINGESPDVFFSPPLKANPEAKERGEPNRHSEEMAVSPGFVELTAATSVLIGIHKKPSGFGVHKYSASAGVDVMAIGSTPAGKRDGVDVYFDSDVSLADISVANLFSLVLPCVESLDQHVSIDKHGTRRIVIGFEIPRDAKDIDLPNHDASLANDATLKIPTIERITPDTVRTPAEFNRWLAEQLRELEEYLSRPIRKPLRRRAKDSLKIFFDRFLSRFSE